MKYTGCLALLMMFFLFPCLSQSQAFKSTPAAAANAWPDSLPWWQRNNLRVMQTNLPAYEAQLNVDSLIEDLQRFSVNTLIINGGGIMAFYPTELDFQYINPYMQDNMLADVIEKCHALDIRVITRFDFSRIHKSIFEQHPDWAYVSPNGDRIINDDVYMAAINAPYVQQKAIEIVEEVIDRYAIDGIFINMPGYHTGNVYEGKHFGVDHNPHDQQRFKTFSGMDLPQEEDPAEPAFAKYQEFKEFTINDWIKRMHDAVKAKNPQIAICTYMDDYVDIIRHETQTNSLPYWLYMASDNVNNTIHSHPDHIVSNASIQQLSFRSRYNAIEPEETVIRLYENLANGSGLDMSLMGDFREYEDERNFDAWEELYGFHKKYEPYFGRYTSPAEICVISPGYWPEGEEAQEYRGIQLMLKEAHLQFDIIEASQMEARADRIGQYKLIILPQIEEISEGAIAVLRQACTEGTAIIATNQSLTGNEEALHELFGAKVVNKEHDGNGFYLHPANKQLFKRFDSQELLFWKFNLGLYDFTDADTSFLPIFTPGRPGPPEKIGGHEPSGYYAVGMKAHEQGMAALMPINLGRLYYIHGYEQHKNILLDLIDELFPDADQLLQTNAHPRVEVVLQQYKENIPSRLNQQEQDGMMLHLVNLTGFSGNTYFEPLPVRELEFRIRCENKPSNLYSMKQEKTVPFRWANGYLSFVLDELEAYDGLIITQ
ncbi:family 10 glycosylhydrolase [Catalinimonas niigatensis]|uniref:family 10 glycosylhydrolase n=1 Tax=Catalinimonas niigatensis TaxID=1397264 RepID=UPI0026657002|nr:family 10 glycosylhydrolase [Catalinimonas niigatensis]WPP48467.1 family 10 glycosylhydrolase [Catalinimonas niigatensis]